MRSDREKRTQRSGETYVAIGRNVRGGLGDGDNNSPRAGPKLPALGAAVPGPSVGASAFLRCCVRRGRESLSHAGGVNIDYSERDGSIMLCRDSGGAKAVTARVDTLTVSSGVMEAMVQHCRREYPREACGIVSGGDGRALGLYPLTNVASDPTHRYLIDTQEQRAALEAMRRAGQGPVAVFHSHPRTLAYPSATDVDMAYHPDLVYVIVSLAMEPPDVRAFRIDRENRRVRPVTLHIAAQQACGGERRA